MAIFANPGSELTDLSDTKSQRPLKQDRWSLMLAGAGAVGWDS